MPARRNHKPWRSVSWVQWILLCVSVIAATDSWAQPIILHLRNGDRLTGTVASENNKELVLTTAYAGRITVPLAEIERREKAPPGKAAVPSPTLAKPTNAPPPSSTSPRPAATGTNKSSPASTAATPKPAASKAEASRQDPRPDFWKFLDSWKGELEVGLNLSFSAKDRQTYAGRFRASHIQATRNQKLLKNDLDYLVSYGRTDGVLSDNRMDGSWKVEYDIGKRFLVYNAIGAGYDEIRKIDLRYDVGPGVGYKWLNRTNLVWLTELGGNYQEQFFTSQLTKTRFSLRLAEEAWWQIATKLRWDEKIEFFPEVDRLGEYRLRAETNLSYLLRDNIALKLTVIDLYETDPPAGVSRNDLQLRSSVGIKF